MHDENKLYQKLKEVIEDKKSLRNPLIEILHQAQHLFGYLPAEVQKFIAEELNIPVNKVYSVVTFYNAFSMKPRGKYVINICTGTACFVKGAPRIIQILSELLDINLGETTEDKLFTLTAVRCVGACSLAPVFVIGEDTYGRIETRKQLQDIITKYRTEA
ncbi:MAG: NAD(P)H-dependent oxidoreductase subunit E [Candidatus Cloacimonetes bacterium]|nr:NAD(P)H-dependent oxidoreductase subunit E [Candidatus Cloacimonadota bacterium]